MKVTIVHERFTEFAGSEQVVAQLAQIWPDAQVIAPIALPDRMPAELSGRIVSTALSRGVRSNGGYAQLLPVLPLAMRHLKVGRPDVVVASHHAFSNQVVYASDAPVVSYVHSPARWVWDATTRVGESGGAIGAAALRAFAHFYRPADRAAASKVTTMIANSSAVAGRINDWWEQPAQVVHPPVDTDFYTPDSSVAREDFLLLAGRLVPYKQPGVAIRAAEQAGHRLIVAGDGRMRAECEKMGGTNTTFLGRVSDEELRSLFRRCSALLMPGVEDFGIVPVEAQACGAPVVATKAGGALDSVHPGLTGVLVEADPDGLSASWEQALRNFDPDVFDSAAIRAHATGFSREIFRQKMSAVVDSSVR